MFNVVPKKLISNLKISYEVKKTSINEHSFTNEYEWQTTNRSV
jgi:hypothetical protein